MRFDTRVWVGLPAVFCALAFPQILQGGLGLAVGVLFGFVACVALWPVRHTLRLRPSRAFFYGGLLFIGAPTLRPIAGETTADWLFAASVLSLAAEILVGRGVQFRLPSLWLVAGGSLVAVGSLLSAAASDTPASALGAGIRFLLVTVAWVWVGALVLERMNDLCLAVLAWTMSAAASSVAAFAQLAFGDVIPGTTPIWHRMTGLAQQVNDFGVITASAILPAAAVFLLTRGRDRWLTALLVLAMIGGLLLSGSVSSMAGLAIGVIVAAALDRRRIARLVARPRILVAGGAAVAAVVAVLSIAVAQGLLVSPWTRLTTTTSVAGGSGLAEQRATLWRRIDTMRIGWATVKDHPLLGAGQNPDGLALAHGRYIHNTVLGAWAGLGFLSMVGLILCLAAPFVATRQLLRRKPSIRTLVIGLTGGAVAFTVYAMTAPSLYRRYGWVPALLLVTLSPQALPSRAFQRRRRDEGPAYEQARPSIPPRLSSATTMRRAVPLLAAVLIVAVAAVAAYAFARGGSGGSKPAAPAQVTTVTSPAASVPRASTNLVSQGDIDHYPAASPQHAFLIWWRASQFVDYQGFLEGFGTQLRRKLAANAKTKRALAAFGGFATNSRVKFLGVRKTPTRATVYTEILYGAAGADGKLVIQTFPRVFRFVRQGGGEWRLENDDFFREIVPVSLRR